MKRQTYQTDLSDAEWAVLGPYFPCSSATGRPRLHTLREILNAIFYIVRGGCAWRLLPHDLPPWKTVYHYFRLWRLSGLWERLNAALRQRLRVWMGRDPHLSAGIVDSQSVKTTGVRSLSSRALSNLAICFCSVLDRPTCRAQRARRPPPSTAWSTRQTSCCWWRAGGCRTS